MVFGLKDSPLQSCCACFEVAAFESCLDSFVVCVRIGAVLIV